MYRSYCKDLALRGHTDKMSKDKTCDEYYKMLNHESLLKQCLTKDIFNKLKTKSTTLGGTLADCVKSGCKNLNSGVGLYACDQEAYTVFEDLFDAVIKKYHEVPTESITHPKDAKYRDGNSITDLDPSKQFIISTRVRVGRSIKGYPFPPLCNDEKRKEIQTKLQNALDTLPEGLKGTYYPLEGMEEKTRKMLVEDHFLFKNDDKYLDDAGGYKSWPESRGIFHTKDKDFLAWINEEDHLRLISMQMGGNLGEVYERLIKAIEHMSKTVEFARSDKLGYLTFCPTNLGTAMRASVHVRVPLLAASGDLGAICEKHSLQPRGIHGEHTESEGGVYDISNKRRLGLTEIDALRQMEKGVKAVIEKEKELQQAKGQSKKK